MICEEMLKVRRCVCEWSSVCVCVWGEGLLVGVSEGMWDGTRRQTYYKEGVVGVVGWMQ